MTMPSETSSTGLAWPAQRLRPRRVLPTLMATLALAVTLTAGQSRPEAFARLTIVTEPGATVVLDDQAPIQVGRNGQAVFEQVRPGAHSVRVTQEGKRAVERTVTLSPGQTLRVEAPLAPVLGRLEILTTPGAMVSIDGEPRGRPMRRACCASATSAWGSAASRRSAPDIRSGRPPSPFAVIST